MKLKGFRWLCLVLCCVLAVAPIPVFGADLTEIDAPSAVLLCGNTGDVLFEKNAHERRACGSVTKVMSILLFMEALDRGEIALEDRVTTSEFAISMGGSEIWLEVGEVMTVDEMLRAIIIQSANDATVAMAEHVAGSEAAFLERMNQKAQALGMKDTFYLNTTGFDEEGQYTSAFDIALAARELLQYPLVFDYTTRWMDELRGGKTELTTTNKLLKTYAGITGLKTGTTDDARNCFCGTAERNGMTLISVVLGCETSAQRFSSTTALLDYGFGNWSVTTPKIDANALVPVKVLGGMHSSVAGDADLGRQILVRKGREGEVISTVELAENVEAPVERGQTIGEIKVSLGGEELCTYPVKAVTAVEKITFGAVFRLLWEQLLLL